MFQGRRLCWVETSGVSLKSIVVIPTYNEIENLPRIVELVREQPGGWHILVVDDGSPDGTGQLADELSDRFPGEIFVLHRPKKEGLGRAYVAAFQWVLARTEYEIIAQMDADLSHDPEHLGPMAELLQRHDLVLGSRYLNGISVLNWDFKRLLLSKGASHYVRLVTGMPYSDATGGFKAWRRDALAAVGLDRLFSNGYLFQIETTYRLHLLKKYSIVETSIVFRDRNLGRSKIDPAIIIEAMGSPPAAGGQIDLRPHAGARFQTGTALDIGSRRMKSPTNSKSAAGAVDRWSLRACCGHAIFLASNLYIAGHRLFWYDEAFTILTTRCRMANDLAGVAEDGFDPSPMGFFIVARTFDRLFGPSEIGIRLPSALAMAAGMLFTYDCARQGDGRLARVSRRGGADLFLSYLLRLRGTRLRPVFMFAAAARGPGSATAPT